MRACFSPCAGVAGSCKACGSAMVAPAGNSCSFANPLCRTAAPAGSESAKGTFGDHMFKGSMGHGALGGAVLCNEQQQCLKGKKRDGSYE